MNQSTSALFPESCSKVETSSLDSHCVVEIVWGKFAYLWTVKHFEQYHFKATSALRSPLFRTSDYPDYVWNWSLFIARPGHECDNYIGVGLSLESSDDLRLREALAAMKFSVLDHERNVLFSRVYNHLFTKETKQYECSQYISKNALLDPDPNNKLLKEDTLIILCELKFTPANKTGTKLYQNPNPEIRSTISDDLSKSLERLLNSQNCVDVTFSVNGKNFGAHKSILVARSPVFEAMFKHDMLENRHSEVNISDIDGAVFEAFLHYMYTDRTPDEIMAKELLVVADRYQVDCLKLICEEVISKQLSFKNALNLLYFADLHSAERLRKNAAFCIKTHPVDLMSTQSWKNLILTCPHLFDVVNGVREVDKESADSLLEALMIQPVKSPELPVPSMDGTSAKRKRS